MPRPDQRLVTCGLAALLGLFALLAPPSAAGETAPHLKTYVWDFGRSSDLNFDSWPDEWQRRRGRSYPNYVKVAIVAHDVQAESQFQAVDTTLVKWWPSFRESFPSLPSLPPSIADAFIDRYLSIQLDGGQALVQSPPQPTSQLFQYHFSCRMMTAGLRQDSANASLVFLDAAGKEVGVVETPAVTGSTRWQRVVIDRVRPPADAATMLVRLSVRGSEDGLQDIHGQIGFDDIRIEPFPQLQLTTDMPLGIYRSDQRIVATAKVLGMPVDPADIHFRLLDHNGNEVKQHRSSVNAPQLNDAAAQWPFDNQSAKPLSSVAVEAAPRTASRNPASSGSTPASPEAANSSATWIIPALPAGFYRITSSFVDDRSTSLATETTIAVIEPLHAGPPAGPFGWTLPRGRGEIEARDLATWLLQLGVAWLKYPCWSSPLDTTTLEQNAAVLSKLQDVGIQTVGMLDAPPEEDFPQYEVRSAREAVAANLFRDPAVWRPQLEPLMTHLTLKVRSWQLGSDDDHSFLGRPRLPELVSNIRSGLQGYGQPIDVAISWPWLEPTLPTSEMSWQAMCRSSKLPLTASELDAFLKLQRSQSQGRDPRTWILLNPIDAARYDRDARIRDLVLRMATVCEHPVQAAFVSDPFAADHGLLREDGRPSEMLLPWRTTSLLLGGLSKVGSLQLRSRAQNAVFRSDGRVVLMMWSMTPKTEEIYLGEDVRQVDVWGRVSSVPTVQHAGHPAQRIEIGPMPIFLIGADENLLAFRMSVTLQQQQLDSFLGQVQQLSVDFSNPTTEALAGEMRIRRPSSWQIDSPTRSWELFPSRSTTQVFDVVLSNSAMIGEYELAIDFDFQTTPAKAITLYRTIHVGVEGLSVKLTTRLTPENELHVVMEMSNQSDRVQSFDCMLFPPPGRQYQRRFVQVAPKETVVREFFWSNGRELVGGRVLLRAVEQDGRRVLNYDAEVIP